MESGQYIKEGYMKYLVLIFVLATIVMCGGMKASANGTTKSMVTPRTTPIGRSTATPRPTERTPSRTRVVRTVRPSATRTPTKTPRPELNFNWSQGSNAALLTESGDYTMAWWSWFRPDVRPKWGKSYILLNHGDKKWDTNGYFSGSAFCPNGQEIADLVEFYFQGKLISFVIYRDVSIVAPGRGNPVIVVAQNFGPKLPGGINIGGVKFFQTTRGFENWYATYVEPYQR